MPIDPVLSRARPTWKATRRAEARSSSVQAPVTSKTRQGAGREAARHLAPGLVVAGAVVEQLGEVGHRSGCGPTTTRTPTSVGGLAHQVQGGLGAGGVEAVGDVGSASNEPPSAARARSTSSGGPTTPAHASGLTSCPASQRPASTRVVAAALRQLARASVSPPGSALACRITTSRRDPPRGCTLTPRTLAPASLPCHASPRSAGRRRAPLRSPPAAGP